MRDGWSQVGISLGAALMFGIGAFRVSSTDGSADGYALLAISMVLVGVALTLELHDRFRGHSDDEDDGRGV